MFFFKNHAENKTGRLVPNLSLCFEIVLCEVLKQVVSTLISIYLFIDLDKQ